MYTLSDVVETLDELQNMKAVQEKDHSMEGYKDVDEFIGIPLGETMVWYFTSIEPDILAASAFGMGLAAGIVMERKNENHGN